MLLPPMGLDFALPGEGIDRLAQELVAQLRQAAEDVVAVAPPDRTFANTIEAWQQALGLVATTQVQATLPAMVSSDRQARVRANAAKERLKAAFDDCYARPDLYAVFSRLPRDTLAPTQQRLLDVALRLFRQNGADLPDEQRAQLMELRGELSRLELRYQENVNEDVSSVLFAQQQLAGCSASFLEHLERDPADGRLRVTAKPPHVLEVLQRAEDADVRRQVLTMRDSRCVSANLPLLLEMLRTRHKIAALLGEPSHAAARIRSNMARTPEAAEGLMRKVLAQLHDVGEAEIRQLKQLKREHMALSERVDDVPLHPWDLAFYTTRMREKVGQIEVERLKQFFPLEHVRDAMFRLYEEILGVRISAAEPQLPAWHADVQAYMVADAERDELLGYFYLDLFPREGKYSHQCVVPLCPTFVRANGARQLPVAAYVGNLQRPHPDAPSLLDHSQVLTLFHEFGHIMHHLSTRAEHVLLSWAWSVVPYPAGVEHDFLEIPSQALESWTWDATVLKRLSMHVATGQALPDDDIEHVQATRTVGEGVRYRRQIFLSLLDLRLHGVDAAPPTPEALRALYDDMHRELTGLSPAPDTAFLASWYHIAQGYDAGYYGYLWSEVLASDVFGRFADAPAGCTDRALGLHYRRTMLEPGATQPGEAMLEAFLGRAPDTTRFIWRFVDHQ